MARNRLADKIIRGLTEFRNALHGDSSKKFKQTVYVKCERCGFVGRAEEMRGGWCKYCNEEAGEEAKS
ncbi:MAG TPA: hypothetical protein VHQ47_08990 [Phycisphaerae bacterium]|nr:hypothetical protein [Phycisphaerae bacterium]HVV72434.1 hypothetical protein [Verrucomicrobiae bacterium]